MAIHHKTTAGIASIRRGILTLMLLLVAFTAAYSWQSWETEKHNELDNWRTLTGLAAKSLDSYFYQIEKMLELLSDDLFDRQGELIPATRAHSLLVRVRQLYPELQNILVLHPSGRLALSLEGVPADLVSFATPSLDIDRKELEGGVTLEVGPPVFSSLQQTWLLPLRYGVRDGRRNLSYILAAMLTVTNPHSFWGDLALPRGAALGVARDDGYIVARYPSPMNLTLADLYGKPHTSGALHRHLAQHPRANEGVIEGVGTIEGAHRFYLFQRLSHYPLTLYVTLPPARILAVWWQHVRSVYLLLAIVFVGTYAVYRRMVRRYSATEDERLRAEERVEEAHERLAELVSSARDAIVAIDQRQHVTLFNQAAEEMFGYAAAEVLGQPVARLIPERFRGAHAAHVAGLGSGSSAPPPNAMRTVTGLRATGEEFPVEASLSRVSSPGGTHYTVIMRDISDRQRAEREIHALNDQLESQVAQLEASNKALASFSYSVSHDLRAPLRAIIGFSEILVMRHAEHLNDTGKAYLRRISGAAQRMGALIDALLSLSRVTHVESVEPVNVSALAATILTELREREPGRPVDADIEQNIIVWGNRALLADVMENLLANAWKFTRPRKHARIAVGTRDHHGVRAVYVQDNGVGFDMKYAGKLFGVFQRLHGTEEFEGTGIGLATVQRIIQLHGGRIWVDAQPDAGATFFFVIPQLRVAEPARRAAGGS